MILFDKKLQLENKHTENGYHKNNDKKAAQTAEWIEYEDCSRCPYIGSRPSGVGMYLNDFLKVLMKYREFEFGTAFRCGRKRVHPIFYGKGNPRNYTGESRIPQCGRVFLLFIYSETVK